MKEPSVSVFAPCRLLILINRFLLSLLFHKLPLPSHPVPSTNPPYFTLASLHFLSPFIFSPPPFSFLHCTRSTYTGFATLATPRFRYRCSAMLTLKMKKTAVTLSYVHTNIRKIWQTSDVSNDGFKPCRC